MRTVILIITLWKSRFNHEHQTNNFQAKDHHRAEHLTIVSMPLHAITLMFTFPLTARRLKSAGSSTAQKKKRPIMHVEEALQCNNNLFVSLVHRMRLLNHLQWCITEKCMLTAAHCLQLCDMNNNLKNRSCPKAVQRCTTRQTLTQN